MKYLVRTTALALMVTLLATTGIPGASAQPGKQKKGAYEVTVTNLTENQILTPVVFAAHTSKADLFDLGTPASPGVREIAENGNLAPLVEALQTMKGVRASGIGDGDAGPLAPGDERSFGIRVGRGVKLLSTVQMVVCTNDGFTGLDSLRLPAKKGRTKTVLLYAFDAGTEINTDDVEDFVPPCSDGSGTTMSNPDLAENGTIAPHPGLDGSAAGDWGFEPDAPVAVITVTRTR